MKCALLSSESVEALSSTQSDDVANAGMTAAQREVWLAQHLAPARSYSIGAYAKVAGEVDASILRAAVQQVVKDVPALRARFHAQDGDARYLIDACVPDLLQCIDFSERESAYGDALEWIRLDLDRSRLPEDGELCAFVLFCVGRAEYVWYQRYHHILIDGRSVALVAKRISAAYATLHGDAVAQSFDPLECDAFVKDDEDYRKSYRNESDHGFWRDYLAQPFDAYALARRVDGVTREPSPYSEAVFAYAATEALKAFGKKHSVHPTSLWMAMVALHFHQLTGRHELQFSLPVASCGRGLTETPGMNSNVIPLRIRLTPGQSVMELAGHVTEVLKKVLRRQRYRGEDIRRDGSANHDTWFGPSINVMHFDCGLPFSGCSFSWYSPTLGPTDDLSMAIIDYGDGHGYQLLLRDHSVVHADDQLQAHALRMMALLDRLLETPDVTVEEFVEYTGRTLPDTLREGMYGLRHHLVAAGYLRWDQSSRSLSALVDACMVGHHLPNAVGLPKLLLRNGSIGITTLDRTDERSDSAPGTVVEISASTWRVSTADYDVIVYGFLHRDSGMTDAAVLAQELGVHAGMRLPLLEPSQVACLTRAHDALSLSQSFWVERLAHDRDLQWPFEQRIDGSLPACWAESPWHGLERVKGANRYVDVFLAAFAIYALRLSDATSLQFGWVRDHTGAKECGELPQLLASDLPFELELDLSMDFETVLVRVAAERQLLAQHASYAKDLCLRFPALRECARWRREHPWSVAVALVDDDDAILRTDPASQAHGGLLTLQICTRSARFRFIYNASRVHADQLDRTYGHLQCLIEGGLAEATASTPIERLPLLGSAERKLLLEDWNATCVAYPTQAGLHALFEEQAQRTPEREALVCGEETLSYAELNRRANRIAHRLVAEGVGPDRLVAVCMERTSALVASLLGVLKAGGAYVPLDPGYPSARLQQILDDAQPAWLLCDNRGAAVLGEQARAARICLDASMLAHDPQQPDGNPLRADSRVSDLAYLIYTSGSTGTPKGVMIEHRQASNLVHWAKDHFTAAERERVLFCTSIQFDLSIFECFVPLSGGGTVQLVDNALSLSRDAAPVSLINTVPSVIKALAEQGALTHTHATINLAGEPLKAELMTRLFATTPLTQLCNLYGPSETTTYSTWTRLTRGQALEETIGRPIANTRIYLLDAHGEPVPLGAVGEIYIGGAGVARGYLHRPELTAERFLIDPFSAEGGARMYRTGDLARYLPDGRLVYLGRNDHQVKIRGFRIELGEIEARLLDHAWVREAVVMVHPGELGEARLVAYVLGAAPVHADWAGTLREHLASRMPEYMVPWAYIPMTAWPLTPNGKLDRKALPEPGGEVHASQAYEAPSGAIECALASIWQNVLDVERVGRHDNFFALGGHSLLALRVMARVRDQLGVSLPLARLFAEPTVAGLAAEVATLRSEVAAQEWPAIALITREGPLPLSFAQQRLWFLTQWTAVSTTYHIPSVVRVRGALDEVALRASLDALVARHESLRSVFVVNEGEPFIQLLPTTTGIDWSSEDGEGLRDAEVTAWIETVTRDAFDLGCGPLIRARLLRCAAQEHVLVLVQHHIVSDGWSTDVLLRELGELYGAQVRGEQASLPVLRVQYPDYAAWQRQWLSGERLKAQADYWREQLADAPVLLELPTDRARPAQQDYAGAHVPVHLDAGLTQQIRQWGRQHGATPYMVVLAAWSVVLSRLSGQDDLVIGTPVANRGGMETEDLIGFFVNTLALRLRIDDTWQMPALLAHVRKVTLAAQDHQDMPFEQVVEIVQPPRRMDHTPLFQVMFAWQNRMHQVCSLADLDVEPLSDAYALSRFDLELELFEEPDTIVGHLNYATVLYDASTMHRHAVYLERMLRALVSDAGQPIAQIELVDDDERSLLASWNATAAPYPDSLCMHQLFEAQVRRTPDAIAVLHEHETLSYAELNVRANRLAHHLISLGVGPDQPVAICVERGVTMVVALMAILKAGGAYVPLDPGYPSERLQQILDDAAPTRLLLDSVGRAALGDASTAIAQVDLQSPLSWAAQPAHDPVVAGLTAQHLAYVIYTSGSTGRPKGVMNEHGALVNRLTWMQKAYGLDGSDVVVQKTSFGFDVSVWEFFWTLSTGAALAVPPPDAHKEAVRLIECIRRWGVTTAHFVPSMLALFIHTDGVEACGSLRRMIFSGEALPAAQVQTCRTKLPQTALHNLYGPTEAAIDVTAWACPVDYTGDVVPIGRPIANTAIYLLDRYGKVVPRGAVGELHIGGVGVARGYLNRADLTAERFVRDPFRAGGRMYKTGDLARYLLDGNIEYLGRNDHQVKVRGFRIELGEIEARLLENASIREAVVIAREDVAGEKRLVAYIVEAVADGDAGQWRAYLAACLPEYMVPTAFVKLESLPVTVNGKLDRKALPVPDGEAYVRRHYEAPYGEMEQAIAKIWQELLRVERIGRHDHFFELGGHSLMAIRMLAQVNSLIGIQIDLSKLFNHPVLADFTREVLIASIEQEFDAGEFKDFLSEGA